MSSTPNGNKLPVWSLVLLVVSGVLNFFLGGVTAALNTDRREIAKIPVIEIKIDNLRNELQAVKAEYHNNLTEVKNDLKAHMKDTK